ncbi:PEP/pyruvate-binding domain-containing protein [Vulcanisaeta sp. JCM 16159]|uniref:PEP/pyruvate-binding domain-containing protein n=1 Tax=Vulcanisaeta sp. JCM 16159 TaxID=1295371 RepID=UPI000A462550
MGSLGKYVLTFEEADPDDVKLIGGKASSLVLMTRLGLPVPPGIIITTKACREYYDKGEKLPEGLMDEVTRGIKYLEEKTGYKLGDPDKPLLVSVRSGAAVSMPGMMDTVLNVGLNDRTVHGLAKRINNEHGAYDAYRRFLAMFGRIVLGIPEEEFNKPLRRLSGSTALRRTRKYRSRGLRNSWKSTSRYTLRGLVRCLMIHGSS